MKSLFRDRQLRNQAVQTDFRVLMYPLQFQEEGFKDGHEAQAASFTTESISRSRSLGR